MPIRLNKSSISSSVLPPFAPKSGGLSSSATIRGNSSNDAVRLALRGRGLSKGPEKTDLLKRLEEENPDSFALRSLSNVEKKGQGILKLIDRIENSKFLDDEERSSLENELAREVKGLASLTGSKSFDKLRRESSIISDQVANSQSASLNTTDYANSLYSRVGFYGSDFLTAVAKGDSNSLANYSEALNSLGARDFSFRPGDSLSDLRTNVKGALKDVAKAEDALGIGSSPLERLEEKLDSIDEEERQQRASGAQLKSAQKLVSEVTKEALKNQKEALAAHSIYPPAVLLHLLSP